ncbi:hypothetical protein BDZ90DRAFT_234915 [Jaminaea rosea]|uniref:DUF1365-domain-containing protein n=1 Tax=Jaminaea rosea TaxID=1569628 RepID=A0A316UNA9_9BASI|nr:hypothetical protein BDZ90DRAFT_234915 [Jaminaea rosea]PWN24645.1 hypothetical protein BDZ90DRAFT_234915 [Jaminaea rosea]
MITSIADHWDGWPLLDAFVSSLCLALTLLLYRRSSSRPHDRKQPLRTPVTSSSSLPPPSAWLVPSYIHHARMLPLASKHTFRYPTLYLAVQLGALEAGECNVGAQGRLFRWNAGSKSNRWAMTALEAIDYLGSNEETSWLAKLELELRQRHWLAAGQTLDADAYEVWAISMPSYFGFHGINPLTVYYIYRKEHGRRGQFWLCLLEVHNTFGERHLYVLPADEGEDREGDEILGKPHIEPLARGDGISYRVQHRRSDYEHQWTFPRSFHVSPFNDRGGYYRLFLKDLWRAGQEGLPTLDVRLLLMEPDLAGTQMTKEEAEVDDHLSEQAPAQLAAQPPLILRKKILATLNSYPHDDGRSSKAPRPLTASHLLSRLARQPLDLVLTFARIAWQAAKLHYGRPRLDVYNKPEPSVVSARRGNGDGEKGSSRTLRGKAFDGIGWPPSLNATQLEREGQQGSPGNEGNGALFWPSPTSSDEEGKRRFVALVRRCTVPVRLLYPDGSTEDLPCTDNTTGKMLDIFLLSPAFFSDLLLYRTPQLALLMGSRVGRRWGVSDTRLYEEVFASAAEGMDTKADSAPCWQLKAARWARYRHERWARRLASDSSPSSTHENQLDIVLPPTFNLFWSVYTQHLALALQEIVFRWLKARYVPGTEPWYEWRQGVALLEEKEEEGGDTVVARL